MPLQPRSGPDVSGKSGDHNSYRIFFRGTCHPPPCFTTTTNHNGACWDFPCYVLAVYSVQQNEPILCSIRERNILHHPIALQIHPEHCRPARAQLPRGRGTRGAGVDVQSIPPAAVPSTPSRSTSSSTSTSCNRAPAAVRKKYRERAFSQAQFLCLPLACHSLLLERIRSQFLQFRERRRPRKRCKERLCALRAGAMWEL
jgi:hypothetical protein